MVLVLEIGAAASYDLLRQLSLIGNISTPRG
jgi:hypothetical protein